MNHSLLFSRATRERVFDGQILPTAETQLERPTAENPAESRLEGLSHAEGQPDEAAGHTCLESARSTLEVPSLVVYFVNAKMIASRFGRN